MKPSIPSIDDLFTNTPVGKIKRVLLRVDFNLPQTGEGHYDEYRLLKALPTIRALRRAHFDILILSHYGRPKGIDMKMSLGHILPLLQRHVEEDVALMPVVFEGVHPGSGITLFENLRFYPGEANNDENFARKLANMADAYVGDAFSVCHRKHASIVSVPKFLPSYGGYYLLEEQENLEKFLEPPVPNDTMVIVGGSKISTKLPLLRTLLTYAQTLAIDGAMAHTLLEASGIPVGASLWEPDQMEAALQFLAEAKSKGKRILLPCDFRIQTEQIVEKLGKEDRALDIGPKSLNALAAAIKQSPVVIWNGPVGLFEDPKFQKGTEAVIQLLENHLHAGNTTIAGGGDTLAALRALGNPEHFSYVSGGGGAFLEWLKERDLPGFQTLRKARP